MYAVGFILLFGEILFVPSTDWGKQGFVLIGLTTGLVGGLDGAALIRAACVTSLTGSSGTFKASAEDLGLLGGVLDLVGGVFGLLGGVFDLRVGVLVLFGGVLAFLVGVIDLLDWTRDLAGGVFDLLGEGTTLVGDVFCFEVLFLGLARGFDATLSSVDLMDLVTGISGNHR